MIDDPVVSSPRGQRNVSQFKQFIQSNKQYLEQKYYEHFFNSQTQSAQKIKLTLLPIERLISFLYEIFSLEKYAKNQKINHAIKSSVQQNLKEYLMELDPNKLIKMNQLTFERLLNILVFIIEKNQIFAVQYQAKGQKNAQNSPKSSSGKKDNNLHVNISINQNGEEDNYGIQDEQNHHYNSSVRLLNGNNGANSFQIDNQFEIPSSLQNSNPQNSSQKLIKKNARVLFDFYCRQQMELGGVITFDRLSQETSSMSLGKCLTFAKAMSLFNALIKRSDFVAKFKKVSQGKKAIDFQKFEAMIGQFQVMDPNFNQRIGLLSDDIRKVLRYVKLPFNTKDIQPRQTVAVRNFSSKLTDHSGQTSESLKVQLQSKKVEIQSVRKLKQIKEYMQWKQSRPELIKQKDLGSNKISKQKDLTVELSFIGSIIHPEQDDSTYLKEHLIPKLQKQTQKIPKFGNVFQSQRYRSLDKITLRKQSVVSDIRKRIKEIQSSENISFLMKSRRQQQIPQPNSIRRYSHR